jgi:hypothetical protein
MQLSSHKISSSHILFINNGGKGMGGMKVNNVLE